MSPGRAGRSAQSAPAVVLPYSRPQSFCTTGVGRAGTPRGRILPAILSVEDPQGAVLADLSSVGWCLTRRRQSTLNRRSHGSQDHRCPRLRLRPTWTNGGSAEPDERGTMKEAVWILLAGGLWFAWMIFRTSRLNRDEKQCELRDLIVEFDRSRKEEANVAILVLGYNRVLMFADGNRAARLAHALSMARPHIASDSYEVVRSIVRQDAKV